jgi:hypothetical protein
MELFALTIYKDIGSFMYGRVLLVASQKECCDFGRNIQRLWGDSNRWLMVLSLEELLNFGDEWNRDMEWRTWKGGEA